jgi:preprotein translocase subunit SecA
LANTLRTGVAHHVLNARKHTEESQIIAGAGAFGAVTIATNMAGRGVDIKLGGEMAEEIISAVNRILKRNGHQAPYDMTLDARLSAVEVLDESDYGIYGSEVAYYKRHMDEQARVWTLGGLHVIGSERHEARRIDNQLRGRAARQGDPGSSRFYLSFEDDLMIRFGGQQMESMLARLNVDEALPITNQLVSRIVEQSQTRVEGANFDVRKHLLEYDDVLNTQREKIYEQRDRILTKDDLSADVIAMLGEDVGMRVPAALEAEDGPWKLLAWLNEIQPSITMRHEIFPSYSLKLLLDDLGAALSPDEAQRALLNMAEGAIHAEAERMINNVDILLENSEISLDAQIDDRLELLDMFIEGLTLSEEPGGRHPKKIAQEFTTLLRLPIKLSPDMARALKDDPYEVGDQLRKIVKEAMMALTITRLIGAVERSLKTPLGLQPDTLLGVDWEGLGDQVIAAIEVIYADRQKHYIGDDHTPGSIAKDLEQGVAKVGKDALSRQDLLSLMLMMPHGRRQSFDKKSRKRTWQSTIRLTYLYLAANTLAAQPDEGISEGVLKHLEGAQQAIHQAWGSSELTRLGKVQLANLDLDARVSMEQALSAAVFAELKDRQIQSLDEEFQAQVSDELGRQALTKIYRELLLRVISGLWIEYLTQMEALRVAIGLEAYAQRDPLVQYKNKAFEMFKQLLRDMRTSMVTRMFTFQPSDASAVQVSTQKATQAPASRPAQAPKKKKGKRRRRR